MIEAPKLFKIGCVGNSPHRWTNRYDIAGLIMLRLLALVCLSGYKILSDFGAWNEKPWLARCFATINSIGLFVIEDRIMMAIDGII